ncbi:hypothetical protein [Thioalkalivibrio sp.]|uniref:hypothetical protein n=1 Tax=Thioalkalivibrio sp. TaxID=2093813 RepID=UPI0012D56F24|nr:hypothetical protein [Thioalkalivibrio sp.]TVP77379.1 MAG: hypothetical protein EA346_12925 [Thioalkalivibrio sp.]
MSEYRSNGPVRAPQHLGETLGAIFARYPRLLGTLLLVGVLLGLLQAATESVQVEGMALLEAGEMPGPAFFVAVLAGLIGSAYLWVVALLRADHALAGDRGNGAFARAGRVLLPVLAYALLYTLLVVTGLVLLALPGIFLAVLLAPGVMLIVLRDSGVFAALKRSAVLVWGSWWFSLGILLTITLVAVIPLSIAEIVLMELRQSPDPGDWLTLAGFNVAVMVLVLPLFTSMAYTLLEALEARRRNVIMEEDLLRRAGSSG